MEVGQIQLGEVGQSGLDFDTFEREEQEITPVARLRGTRTYVHAQVFTWEPNVYLTVGLLSRPAVDGSIGQVVGREQRGQRRQELGKAQSWYYPAEGLLMIWECFFNGFFRDAPLLEDDNMAALWQGLERWLTERFPQAQRIATPFRDPLFKTEDYQAFLRRLGYVPVAKAAFGKALERPSMSIVFGGKICKAEQNGKHRWALSAETA